MSTSDFLFKLLFHLTGEFLSLFVKSLLSVHSYYHSLHPLHSKAKSWLDQNHILEGKQISQLERYHVKTQQYDILTSKSPSASAYLLNINTLDGNVVEVRSQFISLYLQMLMDTVCGLGVMGGIMVDMGLTLCNYILLHQLTTRLNFIYLFIYNIYCASLSLLLLLISSQKMGRFALFPLPKCRPLVNGEHKLGATELPRSVVT